VPPTPDEHPCEPGQSTGVAQPVDRVPRHRPLDPVTRFPTLYFLPSIIAAIRGAKHSFAIGVFNLPLGWTVVAQH
jgi:hypothetical protein